MIPRAIKGVQLRCRQPFCFQHKKTNSTQHSGSNCCNNKRCIRRSFSSYFSRNAANVVEPPSRTTTSWERSAQLVKASVGVEATMQKSNNEQHKEYMERICSMHDPTVHVKTLEDEIRETMGKALGNQASKIQLYLKLMKQEREKYDELVEKIEKHPPSDSQLLHDMKTMLREIVSKHNEFHKEAHTARWELIVHRQAVGFIVRNHEIVYEKYPIGDKITDRDIVLQGRSDRPKDKMANKPETLYSTQLEWWQRVGRWM
jgi:hypothetical protein